MPSKIVRIIKQTIFCVLGIYGSITMFMEAANTFSKAPNFSTEKPTDRCISRFDAAESFGKEQNATMVAYSVNAGRYRWGFCTDLSNEVLDDKFGTENLFDPLKDATNGDCNLQDPALYFDRVSQCIVSGTTKTCGEVLNTTPTPFGVAWSYRIESLTNKTKPPPGPGNQTAPPIAPTDKQKCLAKYVLDNDMPRCPFTNVRFYGVENKFISVLFVLAALSSIGLWIWEIVNVVQFSSSYSKTYGDLKLMAVPNDGTWGAIYTFFRAYIQGESQLGDEPNLTWFQFFRSATNQILCQLVSLVAVLGCNPGQHLLLIVLFVVMTLKLLFSLLMQMKEIARPSQPDPQEILDNAGEVPPPPKIDPNLDSVVADVVRHGKDPKYFQQIAQRVEASPSKFVYRRCLSKLLQEGPGCIQSEIDRLTEICKCETTDPGIYNECVTWIQLLGQCQNFHQGGQGTYPPPAFPSWRQKVAPDLVAAAREIAKEEGKHTAQEMLDAALLQDPNQRKTTPPPPSAPPPQVGSPMNNVQTCQPPPPFPPPSLTQQPPPPPPQQQQQQHFPPNPANLGPPAASYPDGQPCYFNPQLPLAFASYAPAGQIFDVTQSVRNVIQQLGNQPVVNIHKHIGDNFPGQVKFLQVWYQNYQQQQQQHHQTMDLL